MIKCNLCNKKFYDVFLDENEKEEDIFCCGECFHGKIKHRVYNEEAAKKINSKNIKVKQEITQCSNCYKKKIIEVSFSTIHTDERYCNDCWKLLRIDFEFK